jgi:hypothetical protein
MAWTKVEDGTIDKIEVGRIATALGMDRFAVLGRLVRIWSYLGMHSADGRLEGIDGAFLDGLVHHPGFAAQLAAVGWLAMDETGVSVPNFDRHNSEAAISRALTANRVKKHRDSKGAKNGERYKCNAACNADGEANSKRTGSTPCLREPSGSRSAESEQRPNSGIAQPVLRFPAKPQSTEEENIIRLAQDAVFMRGWGAQPDDIGRWRAVLTELAKTMTVAAIEAELNRPDRDKSEPSWDFKNRLRGRNHGKPAAIDPYAGFRAAAPKTPDADAG